MFQPAPMHLRVDANVNSPPQRHDFSDTKPLDLSAELQQSTSHLVQRNIPR